MTQPAPLNGRKVLMAAVVGAALGLALALMLSVVVRNTPVEIPRRAFLIYNALLSAFGGFAGLTLESVRQLQERNPERDYHQKRR